MASSGTKSSSSVMGWPYAVVLLLLVQNAMAVVIIVGDSLGWTNFDLSTQRVPDYAAWAASQPVAFGDSVVFRYAPGFHNVQMLPSKADFDNCNFAKATTLDNGSSGNYTWTAPQKAGVYYFACGVSVEGQGTHCDGGQKLSITLGAAAPAFPPLALSPLGAPTPGGGLVLAPGLPPLASQSPGRAPTSAVVPASSPQLGAVAPAANAPPVVEPISPGGASAAVPIGGSSDQDDTSGGNLAASCWWSIVASTVIALFFVKTY